jgi:uncharacterized membrane protein YjjP (DUF1212 family)
MTREQIDREAITITTSHADGMRLLQLTARLLLEYSARSEMIKRQVDRLARHLALRVSTVIGYREATLIEADGPCCHVQVPELRLNATVNVQTLRVIDSVCKGGVTTEEAIRRLENTGRLAPEYSLWLLTLVFGCGASALAWILRADWGAIAVSGFSSAVGLVLRKELGRRHAIFFSLPFAAAFVGALLGGIAIRAGWTQTPGLCLLVPALMLVPGPHLIHSVQEMLENHMQAGMARLALAATVLVAAALGMVVGVKLTVGALELTATPSDAMHLTLPLDMILAGFAACAFGAFYNTPRRVLWVSVLCGMIGHGIRFVSMEQGLNQVPATLLGCLFIGLSAGIAAQRLQLPFATIAFASSVSMMPGVFIHESFAGALRISSLGRGADASLVAASIALFLKAAFVVGAMVIGLLVGDRLAGWIGSAKDRRLSAD